MGRHSRTSLDTSKANSVKREGCLDFLLFPLGWGTLASGLLHPQHHHDVVERLVDRQRHDGEPGDPAPHESDGRPELEGRLAERAERDASERPGDAEKDGVAPTVFEDPSLGSEESLGGRILILVVAEDLGVLTTVAADELDALDHVVPVEVHRLDDATDAADDEGGTEGGAAASELCVE